MATYTPVPRSIPSPQRSAQITSVEAGDRIDVTDVLGRPARRVQFIMTDAADTIGYRLNNLKKVYGPKSTPAFSKAESVYGIHDREEIEIWSAGSGISLYSSTGAAVIETAETLEVSSIEIDSLSLSTGTTITVIVW